jgi:hypothetical protein
MAPRRKQKPAPSKPRPFKLYLPEDVGARIVAKAEAKGWPQNRVIINELAAYPQLEEIGTLREQVAAIADLLARHSSRLQTHDLSEQLLQAIDAALAAKGPAQQQAALDGVRVIRSQMLKTK